MGLAILGVIVLLYIVLAYFAARTWPTGQAVLVVLLFIASLVFLILSSALMKIHDKWRTQYETAVANIERESEQNQILLRGSKIEGVAGVLQMRGEVERLLIDRGRVWRGMRLANVAEGQLIFDASGWTAAGCQAAPAADDDESFEDDEDVAEDEAAEGQGDPANAAPPAATHGLEADAILFAFKERALAESPGAAIWGDEDNQKLAGCRVPFFYMGEYKVVADPNGNPNAVVLSPTIPLNEAQMEQLNEQYTWAFYEVMPVDSATAFQNSDGETLSREQIEALIPQRNMDPAAYGALVEAYLRDLGAGKENDPPERQWLKVKFTEAYSAPVDVEVADEGGPLADAVFDASGRSQVAALSQDGPTEFQEGDEVTFDYATANRLKVEQKVTLGPSVYHRPKHDYARHFRNYQAELESLQRQIAAADADLASLETSLQTLKSQQTLQQANRKDLQFDIDGLAKERQVLNDYIGSLTAAWDGLRDELSRLYRTNRSLVRSR